MIGSRQARETPRARPTRATATRVAWAYALPPAWLMARSADRETGVSQLGLRRGWSLVDTPWGACELDCSGHRRQRPRVVHLLGNEHQRLTSRWNHCRVVKPFALHADLDVTRQREFLQEQDEQSSGTDRAVQETLPDLAQVAPALRWIALVAR